MAKYINKNNHYLKLSNSVIVQLLKNQFKFLYYKIFHNSQMNNITQQFRSYHRYPKNKFYSLQVPSKLQILKSHHINIPFKNIKSKLPSKQKKYDYLKIIDEDKKLKQNLRRENNFVYLTKREKFASVDNLKRYQRYLNQNQYRRDLQKKSFRLIKNKKIYDESFKNDSKKLELNLNIYQPNQLNQQIIHKKYNHQHYSKNNMHSIRLQRMYQALSQQIIKKIYIAPNVKYDIKYNEGIKQANEAYLNYLEIDGVILTQSTIEKPNHKR